MHQEVSARRAVEEPEEPEPVAPPPARLRQPQGRRPRTQRSWRCPGSDTCGAVGVHPWALQGRQGRRRPPARGPGGPVAPVLGGHLPRLPGPRDVGLRSEAGGDFRAGAEGAFRPANACVRRTGRRAQNDPLHQDTEAPWG